MLHGDTEYYYDLAVRHDPIVHAFIAYSRRMYDELLARLPHRADDDLSSAVRHSAAGRPSGVRAAGPLRVIYAGRLEQAQKGIFDLPEIDRALQAQGHRACQWSIAGAGPDEAELQAALGLQPAGAMDRAPLDHARCSMLYAAQDVFVLPTRFEGFPVALRRSDGRRARAGRQRHRRAVSPRSS